MQRRHTILKLTHFLISRCYSFLLAGNTTLYNSKNYSATLGNALIYIFPGLMFRGAIRKCVSQPTRQQKVEVKIALSSAVLGTVLGIIGAIQAVRSIL